jgi:hypothetical protein
MKLEDVQIGTKVKRRGRLDLDWLYGAKGGTDHGEIRRSEAIMVDGKYFVICNFSLGHGHPELVRLELLEIDDEAL